MLIHTSFSYKAEFWLNCPFYYSFSLYFSIYYSQYFSHLQSPPTNFHHQLHHYSYSYPCSTCLTIWSLISDTAETLPAMSHWFITGALNKGPRLLIFEPAWLLMLSISTWNCRSRWEIVMGLFSLFMFMFWYILMYIEMYYY